MNSTLRAIILASVFSLSACGAQIDPGANASPEDANNVRGEESTYLKWWNSGVTYIHVVLGWYDTDLGVSSGTAIQLRHDSRLLRHGVYGWGFMPEFEDLVTHHHFRFLHLKPQHQFATQDGRVYPAGYIVGISGGDTHDTGLGVYSTGAHLCVQSLVPFTQIFPRGNDGGAGASGGGASCHSSTLNRTVPQGTCVQSGADGQWYTCENGSWNAGRNNCGLSYGFCHSNTLNKDVPPRTCVQSRADRVWYQCDHMGWNSPVSSGAGPVGTCSREYNL